MVNSIFAKIICFLTKICDKQTFYQAGALLLVEYEVCSFLCLEVHLKYKIWVLIPSAKRSFIRIALCYIMFFFCFA